jgi:uncharacterized protein (DUF302 family)
MLTGYCDHYELRIETMREFTESTQRAAIERTYVETGLSYGAAAEAFERQVGRLEPDAAESLRARRAPWSEVEKEMDRMAGPSSLMIFEKIDQGAITSLSGKPMRCRFYLVGNPFIAEQILRIDLRGCLYVPFRVALYDEGGAVGAILSFDRPSSFLAALGRSELNEIGRLLDQKIDTAVRNVRNT